MEIENVTVKIIDMKIRLHTSMVLPTAICAGETSTASGKKLDGWWMSST